MTLFLMLGLALAAPQTANTLSITGVSAPAADGSVWLQVTAGDLDGDGVADSGLLKLRCDKGLPAEALLHLVKGPRDVASGQSSGRRTIVAPHVFETSGARVAGIRPTYDVKENKGARKGYDAYQALALHGAEGLCPAVMEQAVKATKTRSNIQNN